MVRNTPEPFALVETSKASTKEMRICSGTVTTLNFIVTFRQFQNVFSENTRWNVARDNAPSTTKACRSVVSTGYILKIQMSRNAGSSSR